MSNLRSILSVTAFAVTLLSAGTGAAQPSFSERFLSHNAEMTKYQPSLITPVMTPDPRVIQYARFSVSKQTTSEHTETLNFGNNRGGGIVAFNRFEFDWVPPGYIVHNSAAKDGPGDTSILAKVRIASGNAENGNFEVSAMVNRCFSTGTYKNGAATGTYTPTVAAAYAFLRRFDVISALGGTLPTGKAEKQGRTIGWNSVMQYHATRTVWFELENNSTYYFAGSHDGRMQNFVLPAALYVIRRKDWKPTHPFFIVDGGMQIATSGFHTYNHNLITETRIIF